MTSNRIAKAQEAVLNDGVDYILETYETPDFVECVCKMGGDTVVLRVFNDGRIFER